MILELKDLKVGYDSPLITDVNAAVKKGELVVLVGRNGTGKSTLLNSIKGTIQALDGGVLLNKKEVKAFTAQELSKNVAVVNTYRPKLGGWSVIDLLNSTAQLKNTSSEFIAEVLDLCAITDLTLKQADYLSDGEFQKVMIARAICQQTPLVVLDEPTSFLDVVYREQVLQIFSELKSRFDTTLVMSSHNFAPLLKIANQVWIISEGKMKVLTPDFSYESIIESLKK